VQNEWIGVNKKVEIGALDFYIICTDKEDGSLSRLWLVGPRTDADFGAFSEGICELVNLCLLYNIPLKEVINRLRHIKGETAGLTNSDTIHTASSVLDFVAHFLEERYRKFL